MAKRILIVDDEKDMHVYLRTLFRRAGYETEAAMNADEGLQKALGFQPHLITLDLLMPQGSGIKTYEGLRGDERTRDIPVVVLTGLARHEDLFRQIESLPQPDAIIEKPIDREAFLGLVREIIGDPA